ncbi:hypothetical protein [Novosphingobium sp.]|uniref:hypothetical protein n=1 Tax=Novosphingobium sp. TaxID=1874826 RepID=UPI0035AFCFF2
MGTLSLKKTVLGTTLLATALASASPAMANDSRYRRHDNGDTVGAAVVGGIIGLTIGALIASSGKNKRDRCDDRRHDDRRCYARDNRPYYDGYNGNGGGYYNGYPQQGGYYGNDGRYYRNDGGYADGQYGRGYRGY